MTTIERTTSAATRPGGASRFAGIGFAVFFIAASVLLFTGPSVYEDGSITDYAAAHADDARELPVSLSAFILTPIAGILLVLAVTHIAGRITAGEPESAPGRLARIGAAAMATLLTAGAAGASAAQHLASGTGSGFPASAETGYAVDLMGSQVQSVASWGGSLVLVSLGVAARRSGGLPGWLVWSGFVMAPLLLVSWVFFSLPTTLFLVWVAVAGIIAKPPTAAEPA